MKLLTMINQVPWNELILRSSVYTKSGGNYIKHRGLILLRTSLTVAKDLSVWTDDQREWRKFAKHGEWELAEEEAMRQLHKIPRGAIVGACLLIDCHGEFEYELEDTRRFPNPIPYRKSGPVRFDSITINAQIEKQLRKVGFWREAKKAAR